MAQEPNNQHERERQERERREREQQQQPRPGHGQDAHTEQQDHTPRREEQAQRDRQQQATSGRGQRQQPQQRDEKAEQEERDRMAAASIGAQVILDFNAPAGIAARGGAAGSIEGNTIIRDRHLVSLGLDPRDCSGPLPTPEQIKAKREREEFLAKQAAGVFGSPKATRASSLAADLGEGTEPKAEAKVEAA